MSKKNKLPPAAPVHITPPVVNTAAKDEKMNTPASENGELKSLPFPLSLIWGDDYDVSSSGTITYAGNGGTDARGNYVTTAHHDPPPDPVPVAAAPSAASVWGAFPSWLLWLMGGGFILFFFTKSKKR